MAPDRPPQTPASLSGPEPERGHEPEHERGRGHEPEHERGRGHEPEHEDGPRHEREPGHEREQTDHDREKELAARAAAELVGDGMALGLGTGSTVAYLLSALAERARELTRTHCVATSPQTARIAREIGLNVRELDELTARAGGLDLAIDGADQIDEAGWLIKGGGGAHTREKIVAAAARRFVVIVSADKLVERITGPVPLEVMEFGAHTTLRAVGDARLRRPGERGVGEAGVSETRVDEAGIGEAGVGGAGMSDTGRGDAGGTGDAGVSGTTGPVQRSPDGNLLAWYEGPIDDPRKLAARLSATPGVVAHGLFAPEMVSEAIVGGAGGVRRRAGGKSSA